MKPFRFATSSYWGQPSRWVRAPRRGQRCWFVRTSRQLRVAASGWQATFAVEGWMSATTASGHWKQLGVAGWFLYRTGHSVASEGRSVSAALKAGNGNGERTQVPGQRS